MFRALIRPSSDSHDKSCYNLQPRHYSNPQLTSNLQQPKDETTNVVINIIVVSP